MNRAALHEGLRRMRFEHALDRYERGDLSQVEAAEILGISERTFRRWQGRFEEEGAPGLGDRRLGKPSPKRAPAGEIKRMLALFEDRYADFTVKHFHEQLVKRHGYRLGYTVTKVHLQRAGLVRPAPKRSAHRKKRPRRPLIGMMLHQDGSRHAWLEGQAPFDLIVTMDDATGAIYSAFLVEEEGTASTFRALREVIEQHGLFCSLYTDRGSHYFHTPKAGEKVSKLQLTQVGRALTRLGIEHIAAYSPEARGRSERTFRTLQDRVPKELRLAGITTIEAANVWLREVYIGEYNRSFAIEPLEEDAGFVADEAGIWRETLCIIEDRTVAKDNTVAWGGLRLQIPPSRLRPHFVKAAVRVHAYPDGILAVFLGPHRLATFNPEGEPVDLAPAALKASQARPPSRMSAPAMRAPLRPSPSSARRRRAEEDPQAQDRLKGKGSPLRPQTDPDANRLPREHPRTKKRTHRELQKPDKFIRGQQPPASIDPVGAASYAIKSQRDRGAAPLMARPAADRLFRHRVSCRSAAQRGAARAAGKYFDAGGRRYEFDGLSYEYVGETLAQSGVDLSRERIVAAHLGAGASMCALKGGRSVETTKGFSTLLKLPIGSRYSDIGPGVLLYLLGESLLCL